MARDAKHVPYYQNALRCDEHDIEIPLTLPFASSTFIQSWLIRVLTEIATGWSGEGDIRRPTDALRINHVFAQCSSR